jgi:hypothetical protein
MKKSAKKIISLILTFAISLVATVPAFAVERTDKNNQLIRSGNSKLSMSKVLTFNEIVAAISKDSNISKSEAENQVISGFESQNKNTLTSAIVLAERATYRTFGTPFTVTPEYKPELRFYCETSEGDQFHGIVKILKINMNRKYRNMTKQFGGSVYANLEDANTIFYTVDGDFFNNGTTTGGGGVNIGLGETGSVNFNVSQSSNHYSYCYLEERGTF